MFGKLRVLAMLVFSFACVFTGFLFIPFGKAGAFYRKISPAFGSINLWLIGGRAVIEGLENLDKNTNYVFVGNHQSYADIFLLQKSLGKAGLRTLFMAKEELFKVPFFGRSIKEMGLVPVSRGESRKALKAMFEAIDKVKSGYSIAIFPEGSRTYDGNLGEFKKGAFMIADNVELPIVPFVITGTMNVLPRNNAGANRGPCKITFLPAIKPGKYKVKELASVVGSEITDTYLLQKAEMDKIWNA